MNINITATAESLEQAHKLIEAGVDTLYIGGSEFGLRLPRNFSLTEQEKMIKFAHAHNKKVTVAVNGIMHPEKMEKLPAYLRFLEELKVDQITVGDTGVIHVLNRDGYQLPFIYDAHTMVTSARQMNFWSKRGSIGSVIAREVPYLELVEMNHKLLGFGEILVYGATCIHQSLRPLLENYMKFIQADEGIDKDSQLFLSEPRKEETHYSIYEDEHGTHIFANNDLCLVEYVDKLAEADFLHWKLDGIYTPGDEFVAIVHSFVKAKKALETGQWTEELAQTLAKAIQEQHPKERGLDSGFFLMDPEEVK